MIDFLDGDCVFLSLFEKKVLTRKEWKISKITSSSYDVTFELEKSARIAGFTIYIKGTYHCIGITALVNQSKRFIIPIDDIIVKCSISEK